MKQKLGLCCALIHDPDLLILDEPTTGVDPLSRRQFWELIDRIRAGRPGMSVLVATAYMEEAARFDWLVAMDAGRDPGHAARPPTCWRAPARHAGGRLHRPAAGGEAPRPPAVGIPPRAAADDAVVAIEARDLTMRFGDFTAVDHVSFRIGRGEIFGFLGSNGCGKTTTMKMLTGLLPPSEGKAWLFGQAVRPGGLETRRRVGYMSQGFSLYTELTVRQNLDAARAPVPCCRSARSRPRIDEMAGASSLADRGCACPEDAAARPAPAAVAGRGDDPRAGDADPRRADLGRRSGRPGRVLADPVRARARATASRSSSRPIS